MPVAVDNSLYEVRRYFFKPEDWAADGTKYLAWLESMFPVLSKTMDVVCFFGQDPASSRQLRGHCENSTHCMGKTRFLVRPPAAPRTRRRAHQGTG